MIAAMMKERKTNVENMFIGLRVHGFSVELFFGGHPVQPCLHTLLSSRLPLSPCALGSTSNRTNALFLLVCMMQGSMTAVMTKECKKT